MILPQCLNLSTLPSLPLASRKQLPAVAGIYFAINSLGDVQYIGRSRNLRQRWFNHHRKSTLEAVDGIKIAWVQIYDLSLLAKTERVMIEYFKPVLNGSRTGLHDVVADANTKHRQNVLQYLGKGEKTSFKFGKVNETMLPLEDVISVRWTEEKQNNLQQTRGRLSLAELSQRLVSLNVSVSRQYLHRMETDPDVKGVSFELIKALCAVLDVSLEEILCLDCQVNYQ